MKTKNVILRTEVIKGYRYHLELEIDKKIVCSETYSNKMEWANRIKEFYTRHTNAIEIPKVYQW